MLIPHGRHKRVFISFSSRSSSLSSTFSFTGHLRAMRGIVPHLIAVVALDVVVHSDIATGHGGKRHTILLHHSLLLLQL